MLLVTDHKSFQDENRDGRSTPMGMVSLAICPKTGPTGCIIGRPGSCAFPRNVCETHNVSRLTGRHSRPLSPSVARTVLCWFAGAIRAPIMYIGDQPKSREGEKERKRERKKERGKKHAISPANRNRM